MPIDHKLLATEIDRPTLQELLGLSHARVSQLVRDGIITPNGAGKFVLRDVVQAHEKYLQNRVSNTRADAQTRLAELRIKEARLRIREKAGMLYDAIEVNDGYIETVLAMNVRCQSVPSHYTRDRKVREDLENLINRIVCVPTDRDLEAGRLKLGRLRSIIHEPEFSDEPGSADADDHDRGGDRQGD
jgi:hypothetical protein